MEDASSFIQNIILNIMKLDFGNLKLRHIWEIKISTNSFIKGSPHFMIKS